jgi:hypothetical protein
MSYLQGPVQLFKRDGTMVETVRIDTYAEIIMWKNRYYALRSGRYVESDCVHGWPLEDLTPRPIVTTQVQMR